MQMSVGAMPASPGGPQGHTIAMRGGPTGDGGQCRHRPCSRGPQQGLR